MGKLAVADVQAIRQRHAAGVHPSALAARYRVSRAAIRSVVLGLTYRDVPWLPGTAPYKPQQPRGSAAWNAKLSEADVVAIRRLHAAGIRQTALADRYGVDPNTINQIVRRLTWRHVA